MDGRMSGRLEIGCCVNVGIIDKGRIQRPIYSLTPLHMRIAFHIWFFAQCLLCPLLHMSVKAL